MSKRHLAEIFSTMLKLLIISIHIPNFSFLTQLLPEIWSLLFPINLTLRGPKNAVFGVLNMVGVNISNPKLPIAISVRRSICWYNFYANRFSGLGVVTHKYTRNLVNLALSIRVTLNTNLPTVVV